MNTRAFTLVIVLCLSGLLKLSAQKSDKYAAQIKTDKSARHLFLEQCSPGKGFPPFPITKICDDKNGFLWISFENKGFARFDGTNVKWFYHDAEDAATLPDNAIYDMLFDSRNGYGWLATDVGLIQFDPENEKFRVFALSKKTARCFSVLEGKDGCIWANTVQGLAYWNEKSDSLTLFTEKKCFNGQTGSVVPVGSIKPTKGLVQSSDELLWYNCAIYATDGPAQTGIAQLNPSSRETIFWPSFTANTTFIYLDQTEQWLYASAYGNGLLRFSRNTKTIEKFTFSGKNNLTNTIFAIFPHQGQQYWLATADGLKCLDLEKNTVSQFILNENRLPNTDVRAIFKDRHGAIWLGGRAGLFKVNPTAQLFAPQQWLPKNFQAQAACESPRTGEVLFAQHKPDGYLDFCFLNLQTGQRRTFSKECVIKPKESLEVQCLLAASDGNIWVGLDAALGRLDPINGHFELMKNPIEGSKKVLACDQLWVSQITESLNGDLWIATWNSGLIQLERKTGKFIDRTFNLDGRGTNLYNEAITSLLIQQQGTNEHFFIGEFGTGMEIWKPESRSLRRFDKQPNKASNLGGNLITALASDQQGQVWIGTETGLFKMASDSTFVPIKAFQTWILKIVPDKQGRLWLWLREGLGLYDPQSGFSKVFGKEDGFFEPFSAVSPLLLLSDGRIWVGSKTCFSPEKIPTAPTTAVPYIKAFNIYGEPQPLAIRPGELPEKVLQPDQEEFSIRWGLIAPGQSNQWQLQYCLDDGGHNRWINLAEGQDQITFNRLAGGRYKFLVRALDFKKNPIGDPAILPLRIIAPFYRTVWFWGLCFLALTGVIFLFFKTRETQRLEKEAIRLRIARDLHDEVGSTLSTISILSDYALRAAEIDLSRSKFASIGERARTAMENMSDIVWAVNPQNDSMQRVIERLIVFASETLESANITPHFTIGEGVEAMNLPMEKRKEFYMIFKESVNNCAKYSQAQNAHFVLEKHKTNLFFQFLDDGIGLPENLKGGLSGNGMKNMAARAADINAEFSISSTANQGTCITLKIPI